MFTLENTTGFTQSDIALLNQALDTLMKSDPQIEESNASDIINDNWRESGNTVRSLIRRMK